MSDNNEKSVALLEGTGFKLEGVLRKASGEHDRKVYGMLAEECPWLGATFRKKAGQYRVPENVKRLIAPWEIPDAK